MDDNDIFSYVDQCTEKEASNKKKKRMTTFKSLNLSPKLLKNIKFKFLTGIQRKTILRIIQGMDISIVSSTGTGKSYAYVVASVEMALDNKKIMIVLPTKELAIHIFSYISSLIKNLSVSSKLFIGEEKLEKEKKEIEKTDIIVGTVGRLTNVLPDNYEMKINTLILDEADSFLEERLGELYRKIQFNQKIVLSATQTKFETETMIVKDETKLNDNITHYFFYVPMEQKLNALVYFLKKHKRAIIFSNSAKNIEQIENKIKDNYNLGAIYSSMENRKETFRNFSKGHIDVLLATDVLSRGIDITAECVINFDMCDKISFIHRVGRIGRNGGTGIQYSLVSYDDIGYFNEISQDLLNNIEIGRIPEEHLNNGYSGWQGHTNKNTNGKENLNILAIQNHSCFSHKWTLKDELREVKYSKQDKKQRTVPKEENKFKDQFFIPYKKK